MKLPAQLFTSVLVVEVWIFFCFLVLENGTGSTIHLISQAVLVRHEQQVICDWPTKIQSAMPSSKHRRRGAKENASTPAVSASTLSDLPVTATSPPTPSAQPGQQPPSAISSDPLTESFAHLSLDATSGFGVGTTHPACVGASGVGLTVNHLIPPPMATPVAVTYVPGTSTFTPTTAASFEFCGGPPPVVLNTGVPPPGIPPTFIASDLATSGSSGCQLCDIEAGRVLPPPGPVATIPAPFLTSPVVNGSSPPAPTLLGYVLIYYFIIERIDVDQV